MSDKEFFDFCQQNELLRVERDENRQIIIMAPTNTATGIQNAGLLGELIIWNKKKNLVFVAILQRGLHCLMDPFVHRI
jgi:Uma2 family endonuclease